jgi:hypothetical protein
MPVVGPTVLSEAFARYFANHVWMKCSETVQLKFAIDTSFCVNLFQVNTDITIFFD